MLSGIIDDTRFGYLTPRDYLVPTHFDNKRAGYGLRPLGVSGAVGSSAGFSAFLLAAILRHVKIPTGNYDSRKEAYLSRTLKMVRKLNLLVASIMNLLIRGAEAGAITIALLA